MPKTYDLFDDTTMTFGEHLEVLRIHVFRAVLGLFLAVLVSLLFGDRIFHWLRQPVERALRERGVEEFQLDVPQQSFYELITSFFSETPNTSEPISPEPVPEIELRRDQLRVQVSRDELLRALGEDVASHPGPDTAESSSETVQIVITAPEFAQLQRVIEDTSRITTFKVEEGFMAYMKVCFFSGLMLASPWVTYQIWLFVAAGLYPHERRYVYVYLPLSILLFVLGAMAGYFYAFPLMLDFLIGFNQWLGVTVQPRLSEYISMAMLLPLLFGVSFQLPLVMVFLERIGICSVQMYKDNWRIAVLIISIASMLLTTSPDPWSMLLMMFPLLFLYVLGIWLCGFRLNNVQSPIR